ncbi:hypothetical protein BCS84_18600 [Vibrio cyclitrophicus]|uniref:hypothetical protein n=1 Tax=Vibrio cyclitrophicus TaxID=47951 RepID=UPI00030AE7FE|nr:hypothetical protein [Vibrio cyclitrophicus]
MMQICTPELMPLYRYMRTTIVYALGGEPKPGHSDEALDQLIAANSLTILNLLHDLIAMLDYLYALMQAKAPLENGEDEVFAVAGKLIFEVQETTGF